MKAIDFLNYLSGYLNNIPKNQGTNEEQTLHIKEKLSYLFKHTIDKSYTDDQQIQQILNSLHSDEFHFPEDHFSEDYQGPLADEIIRC